MAPISSIEPARADAAALPADAAFLARHGTTLLGLARASIAWSVTRNGQLPVDPAMHPPELQAPGAVFITLTEEGRLRGCVGTPVAWRSVLEDVVENARAAALEDRRFPPLRLADLAAVRIQLSLLGPPVPVQAASEAELLSMLAADRHGLMLCEGPRQALFLPQVWEHLPEPREFLAQLKLKAGLGREHWSDSLEFRCFTARSIVEP